VGWDSLPHPTLFYFIVRDSLRRGEEDTMSDRINYWTWKDSQIVDELKMYNIDLEVYDRKEAIDLLKKAAIEAEIKREKEDVSYEDNDGKIRPEVIKQLEKEQDIPKLMLSRVIFHNTGETDLPYVPVGHNGRAFYIPKEIEVDVPDYILDSVLKDAIEHRMFPQVLQNGQIKWITRKVQRFPYSIIKKSFPAE
jgi:hypothetical protein